jgi:hypothetical protein
MSLVAKEPHPLPGVGRSSIGASGGMGRSKYANITCQRGQVQGPVSMSTYDEIPCLVTVADSGTISEDETRVRKEVKL